jgi:ATP-dependent DNA helicase RecG
MRALIFVREVGAIDNSAYRSLTQTDPLAASKSLRRLRELDILEDRGGGSRTYYVMGAVMRSAPHGDETIAHGAVLGSPSRRALAPADLPPQLRLKFERFNRRIIPEEMKLHCRALLMATNVG